MNFQLIKLTFILVLLFLQAPAQASLEGLYDLQEQKPVDSQTHLEPGDTAPDFSLPCICGEDIRLSDYRGEKNVMLTFIPAAWTPVCSDQWPGYNLARSFFDDSDTAILGISVDNIPSLYSWVEAMGGLWFPVLSDFWPHGRVAEKYGILRSDGTAERAVFMVDKQGRISFVHVEDINRRPRLEVLVQALEKLP